MARVLKYINQSDDFDNEEFSNLGIGVEIQDFTSPDLIEEEIIKISEEYKGKLVGFKGIVSIHGPFLDLKPNSPDPQIRQISYNKYERALKIANYLDADYIIFHSQINPYLNEPKLRGINNKQSKAFWDKILSETAYDGIVLIENIFEETPIMLKEYMETIDLPNIRVNLDIGHAKLRKANLEEWIYELKDYIAYMHIHSNDGQYDEHKRLSTEEISKLKYLLHKYSLEPILSLEYDFDKIDEEIERYTIINH